MVQWLRLPASNAGGTGSITGWGTKTPHGTQPKRKKKVNIPFKFEFQINNEWIKKKKFKYVPSNIWDILILKNDSLFMFWILPGSYTGSAWHGTRPERDVEK